MNKIVMTKKIAKQGKNSIIVIPSYLREVFKPGNVVKIEIENLELNPQNQEKGEN
jgi:bifunctional DNA-binding transcriptional regulator/antitoxin component of YhaV-PrlF toxin-antitoxin module